MRDQTNEKKRKKNERKKERKKERTNEQTKEKASEGEGWVCVRVCVTDISQEMAINDVHYSIS